jgi:hypothetical protein
MTIYRLLEFSVFEPEAVTRLVTAYEDALRILALADRQDPVRRYGSSSEPGNSRFQRRSETGDAASHSGNGEPRRLGWIRNQLGSAGTCLGTGRLE